MKSGYNQDKIWIRGHGRASRTLTLLAGGYHKFQMFVLPFFLSGQHQLTSKLLSQKYKYRIKRTQKSVRYFNNHFLTTNCFFRNIEVQIKNATRKLLSSYYIKRPFQIAF